MVSYSRRNILITQKIKYAISFPTSLNNDILIALDAGGDSRDYKKLNKEMQQEMTRAKSSMGGRSHDDYECKYDMKISISCINTL